jgi:protein-S-isoprenylcysteine O-methyltransferase Ste14
MEANERDGAKVRIPPPLVYLAGVVAGVALHRFAVPLPLPLGAVARAAAAVACAAVGVALIAGALRLFEHTGQDPKPWKTTPEIISSGIYRFTRNPMYVGMGLLQASFAFALANGWILGLLAPVLVVVYATAVRHEETYLEAKFGSAYIEYKRSVGRWI